jgi:hypothetical protein
MYPSPWRSIHMGGSRSVEMDALMVVTRRDGLTNDNT